jgi:ABC-type dipeptide/oligopeptide/nickel transport system ATPase component
LEDSLLQIRDLKTYFFTEAGVVRAVENASVDVRPKETIGLVGESGSGKTVTALSALRIVPRPGRIVAGSIKFEGADVLAMSDEEMRKLRGPKMAMVFQDPSSSLNPVYTVERQLSDILMLHRNLTKKEASERHSICLSLSVFQNHIRVSRHTLTSSAEERNSESRSLELSPVSQHSFSLMNRPQTWM